MLNKIAKQIRVIVRNQGQNAAAATTMSESRIKAIVIAGNSTPKSLKISRKAGIGQRRINMPIPRPAASSNSG